LEGLGREQVNAARNKIGDAIAEVARQYVDAGMLGLLKRVVARADI